jgi:hypothetical protein
VMYVSIVSCGCCKNRFGCCICCNGCTCMLQASIPMFQLFIVHICCKSFRRMSQVFHLSFFVCCKCCIWIF